MLFFSHLNPTKQKLRTVLWNASDIGMDGFITVFIQIGFITKRSEGQQRSGEVKGKEHQRQRQDSGRESRR